MGVVVGSTYAVSLMARSNGTGAVLRVFNGSSEAFSASEVPATWTNYIIYVRSSGLKLQLRIEVDAANASAWTLSTALDVACVLMSGPPEPSGQPTRQPSLQPTRQPSSHPSSGPTNPTCQPSRKPTSQPSLQPIGHPSQQPSVQPSTHPTHPTVAPSPAPTSSSGILAVFILFILCKLLIQLLFSLLD